MKYIFTICSSIAVLVLTSCVPNAKEASIQDQVHKTYAGAAIGVQFTYPYNWYIEEVTDKETVYIRNTEKPVTKETMTPGFEQLWITSDAEQVSEAREQMIQKGESLFNEVMSDVTVQNLTYNSINYTVYTYETIGGLATEVYWQNADGKRYFATHATEVGQSAQESMHNNLLELLQSIE